MSKTLDAPTDRLAPLSTRDPYQGPEIIPGQVPRPTDAKDIDVAVRRYDTLMQQNRFEHTSFWSRFGFMMVSQMALLGFFLRAIADAALQSDLTSVVMSLLLAIPLLALGLLLIGRFERLHHITHWWIKRWLKLILEHEDAAFGDMEIVRGAERDKLSDKIGGVRAEAMAITGVLKRAWHAGILAIVVVAVAKSQLL